MRIATSTALAHTSMESTTFDHGDTLKTDVVPSASYLFVVETEFLLCSGSIDWMCGL